MFGLSELTNGKFYFSIFHIFEVYLSFRSD